MNNINKMSKGYVIINDKRFAVSVAISEQEQMDGLMHQEPPLTSMAFVYPLPQINKFWMNNVRDNLDILFCYKGKIIDIVNGEAMSNKLVGPNQYSDLVIEFPTKITERGHFKVGDDVKLSLSKEAVQKILAS